MSKRKEGAVIHWVRCVLGMHVHDWQAIFFEVNTTGEPVLPAQCTRCGKRLEEL